MLYPLRQIWASWQENAYKKCVSEWTSTYDICQGICSISDMLLFPRWGFTCPSISDCGNLSASDASMFVFTNGAWKKLTIKRRTFKSCILRMLMMSCPIPICCTTASSPSCSARSLDFKISTEVPCITSTTSRSCLVFFKGRWSTMNLRNLGGPIFTMTLKYLRELTMILVQRSGLENSGRWHRHRDEKSDIHHLLHSNAIGMDIQVVSQWI